MTKMTMPGLNPEFEFPDFMTFCLLATPLAKTSEMQGVEDDGACRCSGVPLTCGPAIPGGPERPRGPASPCSRCIGKKTKSE